MYILVFSSQIFLTIDHILACFLQGTWRINYSRFFDGFLNDSTNLIWKAVFSKVKENKDLSSKIGQLFYAKKLFERGL